MPIRSDYFADGIVEDIITALSKLRWLFVIARNSSFVYKGRAIDVKQVGREEYEMSLKAASAVRAIASALVCNWSMPLAGSIIRAER